MKRKSFFKLIITFIAVSVVSCNEPVTVVTDCVHPDGSVTRKIEMKSTEGDINKRFKISDIQVPIDGSWVVKDSCEVGKKGDTTWVRRAEKLFKSVNEINLTYISDSGVNRKATRIAGFRKRFKWFNTEYRFSERIEKRLSYGYPVGDFLNSDELRYFFSPESLKSSKENGPDSLKFKALGDSVKHKTDIWTARNIVSGWIQEFSDLTAGKGDSVMSRKSLKSREAEFTKIIEKDDKVLDSLWKSGIILKEYIGEANALKYRAEADSALDKVVSGIIANFSDYSVRIVMPGKVMGTNGFIDGNNVLLWPVKSDYFLTEPYEMWAESKIPNGWAWIVSGLFIVFVIAGVIFRIIKKD